MFFFFQALNKQIHAIRYYVFFCLFYLPWSSQLVSQTPRYLPMARWRGGNSLSSQGFLGRVKHPYTIECHWWNISLAIEKQTVLKRSRKLSQLNNMHPPDTQKYCVENLEESGLFVGFGIVGKGYRWFLCLFTGKLWEAKVLTNHIISKFYSWRFWTGTVLSSRRNEASRAILTFCGCTFFKIGPVISYK